ncbi:hypothetical protein M758_10G053200 [Ceratodon purpureus]|uniref:Uncharacterized protein n=1 Tax=Ceratodon purpureus TaxID=3225 RepID=A0A8T0GIJ2_CERPU|nr:hypothetical protein KC19_10G056800 [Ceratodon purpureus]KAG0602936.1 hypothetical protein M758_10G053200 [Ceratodon purpureus]
MVTLEITVNKIISLNHRKAMTRMPKVCCQESYSVAELDGEADHDRGSLANESCQTALSMTEMQAVSNLAQIVHCERHAHTPQLRGGGSPHEHPHAHEHEHEHEHEHSCASERSAPNSVTWASSFPGASARNQLYANIPSVSKIPRPASPPKVPKVKWNSDVRCNWPPTSPPRTGPGSASTRRLTAASDSKTRDVGVMTFPAINAEELIKKVEALELELDVHVGNERQLLSVNEQLRKRLEVCLRELNDAGMMHIQLDNLNEEMEKILQLLRHLSERNAALEKEKAQVQAKLEREATLNKFQASRMLRGGSEDHDVDVRDAECQTICSCQQVDTRKRRRERKRWLEEETANGNKSRSKSLSPTQIRKSVVVVPQSLKPEVTLS